MSPPQKKVRRTKRTEPLVLNFFQALTPVLHAPGQWKNPRDHSRDYYKPESWVKLAQLAERGKLHGIFFGDSPAIYGGYKSQGLGGPFNFEEAAKSGNNFPKNDPTAYIAAMAISTKNVSFGITCSTLTEHPYHFARRISTLDHLSNGRVGWNVVTTALPSAGRQLAADNVHPDKNLRYEKADEYLQVVYELLLSSWRDDGVVFDRENGVFSNPDAIREINHEGRHFKVPGPQITEPSPQRMPLVIQAGTSPKGQLLGAKHGEVIFNFAFSPEQLKETIDYTRKLAKEVYGRDPNHLKFLTQIAVILGETHEEAVAKFEELKKYVDYDGMFTQLGGSGTDLSLADWDEDLSKSEFPALQQLAAAFKSWVPNAEDKIITKRFIGENYHNTNTHFVGTAKEVADLIEDYAERSQVDGFNMTNVVNPENFENIVDLLIPELQARGLAQKEYTVDGGTYRENLYRVEGQTYLPEDHYAYPLQWRAGVSKDEFEQSLAKVRVKQDKLIILSKDD
jgi:FMN-dependent oxidoreductase (nitrilotriacetate monooxygenase family)